MIKIAVIVAIMAITIKFRLSHYNYFGKVSPG